MGKTAEYFTMLYDDTKSFINLQKKIIQKDYQDMLTKKHFSSKLINLIKLTESFKDHINHVIEHERICPWDDRLIITDEEVLFLRSHVHFLEYRLEALRSLHYSLGRTREVFLFCCFDSD